MKRLMVNGEELKTAFADDPTAVPVYTSTYQQLTEKENCLFKDLILEKGNFEYYGAIYLEVPFIEILQGKKPGESIQSMRFSHGLEAFNGDGSVKKALKNLEGIVNNMSSQNRWELCASAETERLGSVGICVSGEVTVAATADIFSWVDKASGKRTCDWEEQANKLVWEAEDLKSSDTFLPYIEVWVKTHTIHYVWVKKKSFTSVELRQINDYCEDKGYEVHFVD